jgi:16S rRNA G966 N2-methylase RsmD
MFFSYFIEKSNKNMKIIEKNIKKTLKFKKKEKLFDQKKTIRALLDPGISAIHHSHTHTGISRGGIKLEGHKLLSRC